VNFSVSLAISGFHVTVEIVHQRFERCFELGHQFHSISNILILNSKIFSHIYCKLCDNACQNECVSQLAETKLRCCRIKILTSQIKWDYTCRQVYHPTLIED
jgi:hypothetical protein